MKFVKRHFDKIRSHANRKNMIITVGILATLTLEVMRMHQHALFSSVFTNLMWVWE